GLVHELARRLGHEFGQLGADGRRIGLRAEVGGKLAEDIFLARFLEVCRDHLFRIGCGFLVGLAEQACRPETDELVAPRFGLELHLFVMGELRLESVLAVVEGGHLGPPSGKVHSRSICPPRPAFASPLAGGAGLWLAAGGPMPYRALETRAAPLSAPPERSFHGTTSQEDLRR